MARIFTNPFGSAHHRLKDFRYYETLVHVFVVALLISNLVAAKIVAFGSYRVSGALLLFPITYIFGDIFTEVYGYSASRRAIWVGFFSSMLLTGLGLIIVVMPAAPEWHDQAAYETIFKVAPRMITASLIAFWCGDFVNSYVMAKMKLLTRGRFLWTRTIGSTVAGQAVDTIVVMVLGFAGRTHWALIAKLIYSSYLFKVLYETIATPITYVIVNKLKQVEGVDVYDTATNFNPFKADPANIGVTEKPIASAESLLEA